uniref:Uncharacterized protein n=1 Tax=Rhizophora mucronata TaxID=61149 RepID=A0A2P2PFE3_RHIMU
MLKTQNLDGATCVQILTKLTHLAIKVQNLLT